MGSTGGGGGGFLMCEGGGGGGRGLTKLLACTFNQSVVFQSSKFVKK